MIEFKGFILDEQHLVAPAIDENGKITWWLFSLVPEDESFIVCHSEQEEIFHMKEINPEDFIWNGKHLHIELGENSEKQDSNEVAKKGTQARSDYNQRRNGFFKKRTQRKRT